MPDWRDEYLANLEEAERNNPVNRELVATCSQLADRIAALEAEKALLLPSASASTPTPTSTSDTTTTAAAAAGGTAGAPTATEATTEPAAPAAASADAPAVKQLKFDLAEALRAKGQLQGKLRTAEAELGKLRTKTKADDKRLRDLTAERNALFSRLKDRNEELVGKSKMLKDIQDENLTLNIQLDVTDKKMAQVTAENKQLVERWMKRMGEEAEAMNLANEPARRSGRK